MKKRNLLFILLGIVCGLLLAGGAYFWMHTPEETKIIYSGTLSNIKAPEPSYSPAVKNQNEPRKLKVVNVSYDFSLAPQGNNTYQPTNMLDGNPATAWAVNVDNAPYDCDKLYGPWFTFKGVKLSHIVIRNGYCKNEASFKNNTRAAKIIFNNPEALEEDADNPYEDLYNGPLKDTSEPQVIRIDPNLKSNRHIQYVSMIFYTPSEGGFYKGAKWNDLCISEIEFWGWKD